MGTWLLNARFRDDLSNTTGATCDGVSHIAICAAASAWGMACEQSSNFTQLDDWVLTAPVVAHVRHRTWSKPTSCKFTRAGHYIVITGKNATTNEYTVSDPNSCDEENTHATVRELSEECSLVGFVRIFNVAADPEVLI